MNAMQAIEHYLDQLDLSRLEQERQLTLEGWQERDLWSRLIGEDDDDA